MYMCGDVERERDNERCMYVSQVFPVPIRPTNLPRNLPKHLPNNFPTTSFTPPPSVPKAPLISEKQVSV